MQLTVLGDFNWDIIIRSKKELLNGGDTFGDVLLAPGGSAANVAVWAKRCGLETVFIGKIGSDILGHLAKKDLEAEGVSYNLIESKTENTGTVAVFVNHKAERSMISGKGADFYLLEPELPTTILNKTQHLHLTAWSFFTDPPRSAARHAAKIAKKAGATISFDPGSFQMISEMGVDYFLELSSDLGFDIVFPNYEEGKTLSGYTKPESIVKKLADIYPKALIVLKLDAKGALVYQKGELIPISAIKNTPVDATGAGDSFAAAFLSKYLITNDAKQSAMFASTIASWVVEHIGSRPPIDRKLSQIITSANTT